MSGPPQSEADAVMNPTKPETKVAAEGTTRMSRDTLSITDNRTGKSYEIPIKHDTQYVRNTLTAKILHRLSAAPREPKKAPIANLYEHGRSSGCAPS